HGWPSNSSPVVYTRLDPAGVFGAGARRYRPLYARARHAAAQKRDLALQRQILGADVLTAQQRHAAEHAVIVANQVVELGIGALVARIEAKARDLVQADGAGEVRAHL